MLRLTASPDDRGLRRRLSADGDRVAQYRLQIGQRFHRAEFSAVIWTVVAVFRDAQGLEHATLADEGLRLDEKTLSASVLFDRSRYRLI